MSPNGAQKRLEVKSSGVIIFSGLFYIFWGAEYESEIVQKNFPLKYKTLSKNHVFSGFHLQNKLFTQKVMLQ